MFKNINVKLYVLILFFCAKGLIKKHLKFDLQLFSSRRRVRIFLMDAEEEDEEEEEDELADVSNQSEADGNQSASSIVADSGTEKMEEGNEDKENTGVLTSNTEAAPSW